MALFPGPVPRGTSVRTSPAGYRYLLTILLGLCLLSAGCTGAPVESTSGPAPEAPATTTTDAGVAHSVPTEVRIPKIDARSSLIPLGVNDDGTIQVPPLSQPMQAGWYRFGPAPGEVGPAVILGHVDGGGQKGIFYELKQLTPGDEIDVGREDGTTARFRVDHLTQVPKTQFPTQSVYGATDTPQLRLITCGGAVDRAAHSYLDNIIVYADLT